ncbi:MAG: ATP-binding protein, partial [Chloroflexota bacterium]
LTGSEIGFFHFINSDQKTIALKSWSVKTRQWCAVTEKDSHYPIDKAGVWVDCVRERRAVIHNDYEHLPGKRGLPAGHVPVLRDLAVPVFENDRIVAVIGIGNKREDYDELDVSRLSLVAETLWSCVTRKRAEESLRQMEDELFKAKQHESLSVLAGGIAHDFNNLLQSLLGTISAAKMHLDPSHPAYAHLDRARDAYALTRNLTGQLFAFARGRDLVKGIVCLEDLVRDSVRFALSGSRVRFEFHASRGCTPVEIDEGQIRRMIQNITINAKEAMPGGGTLRVTIEEKALTGDEGFLIGRGRYAKVSFKDEGSGIVREDLTKVFEPYFSTKKTSNQKGTGLGLAISYSIVKRHGGHITVESEKDNGTCFDVYLPIADISAPKHEAKEALPPRPLEGVRVLIMDDEPMITDISGAVLRRSGCEVEVAAEGSEAVRRFREAKATGRPFNVVILDLTVAGETDGRDVLERLMEIDRGVSAIISSGYHHDPVVEDYASHGFKGVLLKPYEPDNLRRVVSSLVNLSARQA